MLVSVLSLLAWGGSAFAGDVSSGSGALPFGVALEATAARAMRVDAIGLTLKAAEQRLLDANRDLQRVGRDVDMAQAVTHIAAARPNATLSVDATDINPRRGIGAGSIADKRIDTTVRLEQLFERGGKRDLRIARAGNLLDAARADLDEARRQQLLALRNAYFGLKFAEDKLDLQCQSASLLEETLVRARIRVQAGDLAPSDLERIRVDQLRAESDVRASVSELRRLQADLARMLAMEGQVMQLHAADPWPQPAAALAADASTMDRPDLRAAQARLQAAQQGRSLADSLRTRDVTIGVQYEHFPPDGRAMYGIGVTIPLFNNYDYRGEIESAYVELGAAEDERRRVEIEAGAQVRQRRVEIDVQAERARRVLDSLLPSARRAAEAAEFAFRHGATGVLDMLDARRTLRAIEIEALAAQADYARARAELAAAQNRDF